jgi:hypothetical protein
MVDGTAVTPDSSLVQGTLTASLDSANVGQRSVNLGGLFTTSQEGYRFDYSPSTVNVTPASLTIAAVSAQKVYDGGVASTATPTASGLKGSDSLTSATQAFNSRHVQGQKGSTLSVTGYVVNDGNGGANYVVSTTNATGTITPAALTVSAVSDTKVYDGTTTSTRLPVVIGLQGSDTAPATSQAFASWHVAGNGLSPLLASAGTLNDGNGGRNYSVSLVPAAGTITTADRVGSSLRGACKLRSSLLRCRTLRR